MEETAALNFVAREIFYNAKLRDTLKTIIGRQGEIVLFIIY